MLPLALSQPTSGHGLANPAYLLICQLAKSRWPHLSRQWCGGSDSLRGSWSALSQYFGNQGQRLISHSPFSHPAAAELSQFREG